MIETSDPADLIRQGHARYQAGEFARAAGLFAQAASSFASQDQSLDAAEARNNESVAWLQANRPDQALRAVEGTAQLFEQAGDDHRAGQAYGNIGAALAALGEIQSAEAAYRQAIRLLEGAGDSDAVSHTQKALSQLQLQSGQPLQALTSMQRGLEEDRSLLSRLVRWLLQLPSRFLSS